LQSEIARLREDSEVSVADKIAAREEELTEQTEEIETLRAQLEELEKENLASSLASELATEQAAENAKLRTEVTELKEERAKMAIQLASLQKKYDEAIRAKEMGDGVLFVENDGLAEQKAEIEKLRAEMAKIRVERNDAGALFGRAWGVMIGTKRDEV
jgi:DNA repair exonuclease SbcCD ATPase subunit